MSKKYIDLYEQIDDETEHFEFRRGIGEALRWLDEHPDQVPGRTITRSEMRERMNENFTTKVRSIDVEAYTESLGRIVVPDPEPTNAEKLEKLLKQKSAMTNYGAVIVAKRLDAAGVTAPEGK